MGGTQVKNDRSSAAHKETITCSKNEGLDEIYDELFFSQWGVTNQAYIRSAEIITHRLYQEFLPCRMVDLGCGCGAYAHFFQQLGVEVIAIDGVIPPKQFRFDDVCFHKRDLCRRLNNSWGSFDMALCLDVAEHIPESQSHRFLKNITGFSDLLLLACAPPGQGGQHHVNEQPKRYWVRRLSDYGFVYSRKQTGTLCESFKLIRPPLMWMWEHISVYRRQTTIKPG